MSGKSGSASEPAPDATSGRATRPAVQEMAACLRRAWNRGWLFGLLMIAATAVSYQPVWHGGFIWDDDCYVTNNKMLSATDGLRRIWFSFESPSQYFPLTYTVLRFERGLWQLDPSGYHWVNILLHAANALLLWRVLWRLEVPGARLGAAIFALHPVHVESVAWITELKNVLSLWFCLLAVLAWIEFVEERSRRPWRLYVLTLILYALALLSKSTACTLPAALCLILWLKRVPLNRCRLAQIVPFLMLGLGMGLLAMWWERYHQGTRGEIFALGPIDRILIASRAVLFYLGKLVWPANLTFSYPRWTIDPTNPLAYGWLVAGACLSAVVWLTRRSTGRGIETAAVFYVATLSPILGFIMLYTFQYTFVADHYQYAASIGPLALAAAGMTRALEPIGGKKAFVRPALCAGLVVVLGVLTWRQSGTYTDIETLWRTTLARNPKASLAHENLGVLLDVRGEVDEAITHFQKALECRPGFGELQNDLGVAYLQKDKISEAIEQFQIALEHQPNLEKAHYNLGKAFLETGQVDEAIAHFQRAVEILPSFAEAHHYLAIAFLRKRQVDEAITQLQCALEIQPDYAEAHIKLGTVLFERGHVTDAFAHFQRALEIQPNNASLLNNVAWIRAANPEARCRDGAEAVRLAERACQVTEYKVPMMIGTLAAAYAEAGRFDDAVAEAERARNLAITLGKTELAAKNEELLGLFKAHQPYRETPR